MEPAPLQQQPTWWPLPQQQQQQEISVHVTSDSDCLLWDAELLAFIGDVVTVKCSGDTKSEPEDGSGAVLTDLSTSESLSEEDIEFIVRSTDEKAPEWHVLATTAPADRTDRDDATSATTASQAAGVAKSTVGRRSVANQAVRSRAKPGAKANTFTALTLSISAMSSAEEARRERNRLKVRRLYYRKLDRMNALRTQVADLEENLKRLRLVPTSSTDTTGKMERGIIIQVPSTKSTVDYAALLEQLISTRQRLQHENEYLRRIVSQHVKSVHAISVKLMQQRVPSVAHLTIKPVTLQECVELRNRIISQVHKLAQRKTMFTYAESICGWHSSHFIQNSTFQFSMEKVQPYYSADQIGERVWAVLCDPVQFTRLFSTAVGMKCYVLQTIDADNFVVFQEFRTMNPLEEHQVIVRTLLLVSRMRLESGGFLIMLSSLDQDKWVLEDMTTSPQDTVFWSYLSCWMQYTDVPESPDCWNLFAGILPIVGSNVGFWMLEMVQLAVRCENLTIGPGSYSLLAITDEDGNV